MTPFLMNFNALDELSLYSWFYGPHVYGALFYGMVFLKVLTDPRETSDLVSRLIYRSMKKVFLIALVLCYLVGCGVSYM